ncbi:MAG: globin [Planctomycetota bacterium]
MDVLPENEIYEAVGEDGFRKLCAAFYAQVPEDDILGPMYPQEDMEGAEERLLSFLVYRFGGPQDYIEKRGHPRLRARHMPFVINSAGAQRWLEIMDRAMDEAEIPAPARATLQVFFEHIANFMINSRD